MYVHVLTTTKNNIKKAQKHKKNFESTRKTAPTIL